MKAAARPARRAGRPPGPGGAPPAGPGRARPGSERGRRRAFRTRGPARPGAGDRRACPRPAATPRTPRGPAHWEGFF